MTKQEIEFVKVNEQHFDLVLNSAQHWDASHDIASRVLKIAEQFNEGNPIENCTGCHFKAYQNVWNAYQETLTKKK